VFKNQDPGYVLPHVSGCRTGNMMLNGLPGAGYLETVNYPPGKYELSFRAFYDKDTRYSKFTSCSLESLLELEGEEFSLYARKNTLLGEYAVNNIQLIFDE